jgi:hypothetical protein
MSGKNQNYKNHRRLSPGHHFLNYGLIGVMLTAGIIILSCGHKPMLGGLVILNSVILGLIALFSRIFALKAQDRAIRAEEHLRYFILTGKRMSPALRLGQIIALRFASDEEFVALCERAEKENMKPNDIKMAIKNWRADFHRV